MTDRQPSPDQHIRRLRKRHVVGIGAALAYLAAGLAATPKIRHDWWYLQENVNRKFSTFCGLSAASCLFPWCIPAGVAACRNMRDRGVPARIDPAVFSMALGTGKDAEHIDARVMTAAMFKSRLENYKKDHGGYRLWCSGRFDYCLTPPGEVDFGKVLERFSDEHTFEAFASARLYSPAALFSCYMGDDPQIDLAFAGIPSHGSILGAVTSLRVLFRPAPKGALAPVSASRFMPFDVRFPEWLRRGSADAAMFLDFEDRYETVQEARREALLGFDYADRGMSTNALACWAKAAKAHPRDPVLMELAEALDREARAYLEIGNVNGALKCYENRIEVFPGDVAAIHNFGVCLKKAGHHKLAVRVFAKAVDMDPLQDDHRLELADCAETGGLAEIALCQLETLLKRRPGDPELVKRRARILVNKHFKSQERKLAPARDNSPARYLSPDKAERKR